MSLIPQSPALAEASEASLEELFSRDPLGYQQQDLDKIITVLRAQRLKFIEAERTGAKPPRTVKPGKTVATAADVDF